MRKRGDAFCGLIPRLSYAARSLLIVSGLTLLGCAHVKPIVAYTCMGCQGLIGSGLCRQMLAAQPQAPPPVIPECREKEVLVVENWDAVCREGAAPILKCEKP